MRVRSFQEISQEGKERATGYIITPTETFLLENGSIIKCMAKGSILGQWMDEPPRESGSSERSMVNTSLKLLIDKKNTFGMKAVLSRRL